MLVPWTLLSGLLSKLLVSIQIPYVVRRSPIPSKDFAAYGFIGCNSYCVLVLIEREEKCSIQFIPDKSWTKTDSYLHRLSRWLLTTHVTQYGLTCNRIAITGHSFVAICLGLVVHFCPDSTPICSLNKCRFVNSKNPGDDIEWDYWQSSGSSFTNMDELNFNLSMDEWLHPLLCVDWNYWYILKLRRLQPLKFGNG